MRYDKKEKHHSSSLLKAFQIRLFFNTSIFHFIGTSFNLTNCYICVVTRKISKTLNSSIRVNATYKAGFRLCRPI